MPILVPNRHTHHNPRSSIYARVFARFRDSPRKTLTRPALVQLGTRLANTSRVTVLGELLLVTSSVAVSLGLSRLALGELFRLVRIDSDRPSSPDATRR
jgi:hypothetical protein